MAGKSKSGLSLLALDACSMSRAVEGALLNFAADSTIARSAVALALDAKATVVAVARAWGGNVTNITLPSLLAEALAFEAVAVSGAV